jgi:D-lyxose ketol-isomerase
MALTIATGAHYHWVKSISAMTHGNGALKITLHGERDETSQQFNEAEITVFTDDVALTERLIAAINGAAKAETIPAQSEAA